MFWLDWKLFGNGHGMASPYCDDVFYWLNGRFYRWSPGFGAQLRSCEWRTPKPGTRRRLFGYDFVIFQTRRHGPRVECSWALAGGIKDADTLRALHKELIAWGHGK